MGIIDDVSAFGKGLTQKTKDMVEVTSNNNRIAALEKQVDDEYRILGEKVFVDKVNELEGPYQDELNAIRSLMAEINKIQNENKAIEDAQAAAAQASAEAKAVAAQLAAEAKAAKQATIDAGAEAAREVERKAAIAAGNKFCPKCGTVIPAEHSFCSECGTKVE
ncbi:MAG: zinc ribbon domain-containing protein [Lachnospiraceae bacterium]|nr:zinc ribbon domain-containing protein [Lachnospiraceae bacterium]